jgi:hypothetical protein
MEFTSRLAVPADVPELTALMDLAIAQLQRAFLDDAQIASSRAIMGIDTELIEDGTYFVVESNTDIAGCGGWSRRATLYGGNQTPGRDSNLLDPAVDPARVRAMYTNPAYARRGVGRRDIAKIDGTRRSREDDDRVLLSRHARPAQARGAESHRLAVRRDVAVDEHAGPMCGADAAFVRHEHAGVYGRGRLGARVNLVHVCLETQSSRRTSDRHDSKSKA